MGASEYIINALGIAGVITVMVLAMVLSLKMKKAKDLETENEKLKKSLDEMDEQAKLIIRTDIELNKTQEELDKKVNNLYVLQGLSRAISTTLSSCSMAGGTSTRDSGSVRPLMNGAAWANLTSHVRFPRLPPSSRFAP